MKGIDKKRPNKRPVSLQLVYLFYFVNVAVQVPLFPVIGVVF